MLGLRFCARAFSSCGKRGPLFIVVRGPLTIMASLVVEHRLQPHRLSSCGPRASCSAACGIFSDQGLNPCPLHRQADSQPLRHQGSPLCYVLPAQKKALLFLASSTRGKERWSGFRIWVCLCWGSVFHSPQPWRKFSNEEGKNELKSRMPCWKPTCFLRRILVAFLPLLWELFRQCNGQKQITEQRTQSEDPHPMFSALTLKTGKKSPRPN